MNQYEAKAYVALLRIGAANAYKISKESGIPRARIYDILESLTVRGIAMFEETNEGKKIYTPIPVNVFLEQAHDKWTSIYNYVENELKVLESQDKKQDVYVATVRGEKNILAFCKTLLRNAKQKVIISVWNPMYSELHIDLQECIRRGCNVSGITFEVETPINALDKHQINKLHNSINKKKWFILSVDSRELLYGHSSELNGDAFYTDDATHIYLLEDYIFHDVLVNRIIEKENKSHETTQMISEILSEMKIN